MFDAPVGEIHKSATSFSSRALGSSPPCRSWCAPSIAVLPNTAIAAIAAIATERVRVDISSPNAIAGTTLAIRRRWRSASASTDASATGSRSSIEPTSATMPIVAADGMASRMTVVTVRQAALAATSIRVCSGRSASSPASSPTASIALARNAAKSGASDASVAASVPATTESTTVCQSTMRAVPTGKAIPR